MLDGKMFDRLGRTAALAMAAVMVTAVGACDDGLAGPQEGSLTVRLTDAPGDLDAAWISVTEIRLQGQSEEGPGGTTLTAQSDVDPIPLEKGQVTELISGASVSPGTYAQLRLVVDGGVVRATDGDVYTFGDTPLPDGVSESDVVGSFQCPSCVQTGVKVVLPDGGIEIEDASTILMLDFNVEESFGHTAGQSGAFVMRPLIVASDVSVSGNIEGTVANESGTAFPLSCGGMTDNVTLQDFTPLAIVSGSDPQVSQEGEVASDGTFRIEFLSPDAYDMGFVETLQFENGETLTFSAGVTPQQVNVESGQTTGGVEYTITEIDASGCTSGSSS